MAPLMDFVESSAIPGVGCGFLAPQVEDGPLPGLIPTWSVAPSHLHRIGCWYESAMGRRGRDGMDTEGFAGHFGGCSFESTYMWGGDDLGYILGYFRGGMFVVSHFAPRSLRSGVKLFRDLGESDDIPVAMGITGDLWETLAKMGTWRKHPFEFVADFRGEATEKVVVYNSFPGVRAMIDRELSKIFT
jgi:hypothetical protein